MMHTGLTRFLESRRTAQGRKCQFKIFEGERSGAIPFRRISQIPNGGVGRGARIRSYGLKRQEFGLTKHSLHGNELPFSCVN